MKQTIHNFLITIMLCTQMLNAATPLAFDFGGMKITANDMATAVAATVKAVEETAQNNRAKKEAAISKLNQQLVEIGKKADKGLIGVHEYEQNKTVLMQAINRLNNDLDQMSKGAEKLGDNVQNALMGGWQAMLERQREEQERKTRVAEVAVAHTIDNEGAMERLRMVIENPKQGAMLAALVSAGVFGTYYGCKGAYHAAEIMLEKQPDWIEETSYHGGMWNNMLTALPSWMYTPPVLPTFDQTFVFEQNLTTQLQEIALMIKTAHDKGLPLQSVLLHGLPGTGKTLYARWLAHTVGIDYVIVKLSKLASFKPGGAIQALDDLFTWAKLSPKGMLIVADEIDSLGCTRDKLSELWLLLQNNWLQETGTPSEKIVVAGMTNRFNSLDTAFADRFPHKIEIPLPGVTERERLVNLYLAKYIVNDKRMIKHNGVKVEAQLKLSPEIDTTYLQMIAEKTEHFSARKIEQLIEAIRSQSYLTDDLVVTKALFERVLGRMMPKA